MDHVVFLNKKFKGLQKILAGQKRAEARYATGKRIPYERVAEKDTLYFKSTNEDIYTVATVTKVLFADKLTPPMMHDLLNKNNSLLCLPDAEIENASKKKCLSIIFFDNVKEIPHFDIDKSNYSSMADWIDIENISEIKIAHS